jgi:hypothetical protein
VEYYIASVQNYLEFPTALRTKSISGLQGMESFCLPPVCFHVPEILTSFFQLSRAHWSFTKHSISVSTWHFTLSVTWSIPSSTCLPHLHHNDVHFRCHCRHNHLLMLDLWPFCHMCIQNIFPNWTLWSWEKKILLILKGVHSQFLQYFQIKKKEAHSFWDLLLFLLLFVF